MTQTPSGNKLLTGSGKRSAVIVTSKYSLTKTTDYVCIASIFTCIFPREKRPTSLPWHALYDGSPLLIHQTSLFANARNAETHQ
jgi:hypothetical protein